MQKISIFHGITARYDVLKIKFVDIPYRTIDTNYVEISSSCHRNLQGLRRTKNARNCLIDQIIPTCILRVFVRPPPPLELMHVLFRKEYCLWFSEHCLRSGISEIFPVSLACHYHGIYGTLPVLVFRTNKFTGRWSPF
jgi:hypothetical protein